MQKQTVLGRGAMIALSALFLLATVSAPVAAQPASKALGTPVPTPALPPPTLAAFGRAWDDVTAYSATVTVFEQQGADVQNIVFDYTLSEAGELHRAGYQGSQCGRNLDVGRRNHGASHARPWTLRSVVQADNFARSRPRVPSRRVRESRSMAPLPNCCRSSLRIRPRTPGLPARPSISRLRRNFQDASRPTKERRWCARSISRTSSLRSEGSIS